jgi:hypothetical protein
MQCEYIANLTSPDPCWTRSLDSDHGPTQSKASPNQNMALTRGVHASPSLVQVPRHLVHGPHPYSEARGGPEMDRWTNKDLERR